ncbi:DUF1697 domain-containing protein [Bacillus sp. NEB1478]|uniref:DUF1697 domain-containing protein n=1 Tax=Bacillus sp. NEB1478 TaxID=3073816 RepID=UPI0028734ED0|nr:DUF1697 domain-containing protein [Bacillus sp. NEB1478]WNB93802.1 DUF1697 domain-containing protein [Bacillus sp. NEB1478]
MTSYLALLRGINVGGYKKIKMEELRQLFMKIGLSHVKTYIQSGNVMFQSEKTPSDLIEKLENEIEKEYGFTVIVVLLTAQELELILCDCPYAVDSLKEGESLHFAFLSEVPPLDKINHLENFNRGVDEYQMKGKTIYLYLRQSIRDSKLAVQLSKLGVHVTVRNWNTTNKLADLVRTIGN